MPLVKTGNLQRLGGLAQRRDGVAGVHVGPGDDHRTLGAGEQRGGLGHVVRVGLDDRSTPVSAGSVASPKPNTTSSGRSRKTGPRCGVTARSRAASRSAPATSSVAVTVAAFLVIDAYQRYVVDLLQAAGAPTELRRPPTEHDAPARR